MLNGMEWRFEWYNYYKETPLCPVRVEQVRVLDAASIADPLLRQSIDPADGEQLSL